MITEATNIILKCSDDALEGIAERSLIELQNRKNTEHLEKMKALINHLLGEIEHDFVTAKEVKVSNERPEIDLNDLLVQKAKSGELVVGTAPQNVSLETQVAIEKMTDNLKTKATTEN